MSKISIMFSIAVTMTVKFPLVEAFIGQETVCDSEGKMT
jgi:hypothetical protein